MTFVFDIDDTICDTDEFSEKFILNFFKTHNLPYKLITKNVRYAEKKFDWDNETALKWYKSHGDEMMINFPSKKDVAETINKLHELGHRIVIATARSTDWHTNPKEVTLQWLHNNNIPFDDFYIGRLDKEKICEAENADVFVDDDLEITSRVAEYFAGRENKFVFLANTNYNSNKTPAPNVVRLEKFTDILKFINIK